MIIQIVRFFVVMLLDVARVQSKHFEVDTNQLAAKDNILPQIIDGNIHFANVFYNSMSKNLSEENFVFSPASTHLVLCLLYMGAKGKTARKLAEALLLPMNRDLIKSVLQEVLVGKLSEPQLIRATNIFIDNQYKINDELFLSTPGDFRSIVKSVSFRIPCLARNRINWLVERETEGKITEVTPNGFNTLTEMVVLSSVYFKGQWKNPFDLKRTSIQTFVTVANEEKEIEMMNVEASMKIVNNYDIGASVLQMDFENNARLAFTIILPFRNQNLPSVEEVLKKSNLRNVTNLNDVKVQKINVYLPRFQIEINANIDRELNESGFTYIYSSLPDFSGLADGKVEVSEVIHKAVIRVDEYGTDAKTVISSEESQPLRDDIVPGKHDFVVNRPFIFLTLWKELGAILYMGRFNGPTL